MQLLRNFKSFDFGEATFRYYGTYGPVNGLVIQLVQLFEGDCIVKIDEQDYILRKGETSLIIAKQKLEYIYPAETSHRVRWCNVKLQGHSQLPSLISSQYTISTTEKLDFIFQSALEVEYTDSVNASILRDSYGQTLFNEFVNEIEEEEFKSPLPLPVRECLKYINRNLVSDISAKSVSEDLKYSYAFMNSIFKKNIGLSIAKYIWTERVNKAYQLLTEEDYSVLEISEICGFKNQQHFSRAIKEQFKRTPTEIRRLTRRYHYTQICSEQTYNNAAV